jgi:outer membrane protein insertion porin family
MRERRSAAALRRACAGVAAGCLAGLILVVATSVVAAGPPAAPAVRAKPKLVLLPMVVHSNESPDYLRQGLSDMLTARFTKENLIDVIAVADPGKATIDVDEALETAKDMGAEFVVFGSFTRFGQGASLDVQTAALASGPDGETLREIFVHSGSIGEVIPDLDDLVGKITRFATGGEGLPASAAGGGAAAAPGQPSRSDLLRRIEALEAQMQALQPAGPRPN